nr:copper/silver efflux system outer membrane protein CusC [Raoultella sp. NCTC 9187]
MARETLQNYRQSYAFVEKQLLTGSSSVLALEQARGVIESTRADIARREGELAQANNALQLLLGSYQRLPDDAADGAGDIHSLRLPPALSSQILLQRPDIFRGRARAAGGERQYRRRAGGLLPVDYANQFAFRQQRRPLQPV